MKRNKPKKGLLLSQRRVTNLPRVWWDLCHELCGEGQYTTAEAIAEVARLYNVSVETVRREAFITEKAMYMRAQRRIDDLIRDAYKARGPPHALDLAAIAHSVYNASGALLQPDTVLRMARRYSARTGIQLLVETPGTDPPQYLLGKLI
jgi:hypothetical protein